MTGLDPTQQLRLRQQWGFVPRIFQSPTARAPVAFGLLEAILFQGTVLNRIQKELILLVAASARQDAYWTGIHFQTLLLLGMPEEAAESAASQCPPLSLPDPAKALADFAARVTAHGRYSHETLTGAGCTDPMLLDAALTIALGDLLGAMAQEQNPPPDFGFWPLPWLPLGELACPGAGDLSFEQLFPRARATRPDLVWPEHFGSIRPRTPADFPHPPSSGARLAQWEADPDAELVREARNGGTDAFEQLVHKHGRRVYRTAAGILGDPEEARDVMQETFLKAYHRLPSFEGRSKFSTWLVSISANAAIERIRSRRPTESLDEGHAGEDGAFRPRLLQAWTDSPEQFYAKTEMKEIIQREVRRLPVIYRTVVVLRDIEQLSTQEAAEALGVGIPVIKSRLLRARLLLREALSPHFAAGLTRGKPRSPGATHEGAVR